MESPQFLVSVHVLCCVPVCLENRAHTFAKMILLLKLLLCKVIDVAVCVCSQCVFFILDCSDTFEQIIVPFIDKKQQDLDLEKLHTALVLFDCFRGQTTATIESLLQKNNIVAVQIPPNSFSVVWERGRG